MKKIRFLLTGLALLLPAFAAAQRPSTGAAGGYIGEDLGDTNPCREEAKLLCKGMKMNDGKYAECLRSQQDKVSFACLTRIMEKKAEIPKTNPCVIDGERLCKNLKPGDGRFMRCLIGHDSRLSEGCRKIIEKNMKARAKSSACRNDIEKFCKNLTGDYKELRACLARNFAELSPECQLLGRIAP
ncbi:MAG: hypothetical protein A2234_04865 [Elusimicrobia bacterium RIFOXYA2_FULL_58_8]|nr:MAG: hypothetical protein A2285_07330 [Elusimicrobia bacterium RIFOXYA12_FULL_57_11]OGS16563.1 MAG: hypothetical protein A2234_04865 [Elusimicrobia bacterium RIFOXYA2_FULL_58_8]